MDIRWLEGNEDLTEAYNIRLKVFVEEQDVPIEEEIDEIDMIAQHIIVYKNSIPVGTGRVFQQKDKFYLGRIAVLKTYRGQNIGDFMVRKLMEKAFEMGAHEVHIHAQITVEEFYKKQGFKPYGKEYYEAGIKHINMLVKTD